MDLNNRINSILVEYSVRKNNNHVGSGLGGNITYLGYAHGKKSIITPEVLDVEFRDNQIFWNPKFLELSKTEIRTRLDEVIKKNIEKENFTFPISDDTKIDWSLVDGKDGKIKHLDVKKLLNDCVDDQFTFKLDLLELDTVSKLCLASRICAAFVKYLDGLPNANTKDLKYSKAFLGLISQFDMSISAFAMRTQIRIDRIVHFGLDEDKVLASYLYEIAHAVDAD